MVSATVWASAVVSPGCHNDPTVQGFHNNDASQAIAMKDADQGFSDGQDCHEGVS